MPAVAEYKGKKYRYVDTFTGKDRRRWVKMQWFSDANKEFVAPADQVKVTGSGNSPRPKREPRCSCPRPIEEGDGTCLACGFEI